MYNLNFLPHSYIEYKQKKIKAKYMLIYATFFMVYISILFSIYLNTKRLGMETEEKKQFGINLLSKNYINSDNELNYVKEKDMYIFRELNELVKFIGKEAQIVKLEINRDNIILNLTVISNAEYVDFINKIEKSSRYTIKQISPPKDKDNLVHFALSLQYS